MEKSDTMVISDYYYSLDLKERAKFRNFVMNKAEMSYTTFYGKMKENRWSSLERDFVLNLIQENKNQNSYEF